MRQSGKGSQTAPDWHEWHRPIKIQNEVNTKKGKERKGGGRRNEDIQQGGVNKGIK